MPDPVPETIPSSWLDALPELLPNLAVRVRHVRNSPRQCDLHTSELVQSAVARFLELATREQRLLTDLDLGKLLWQYADRVIIDAIRRRKVRRNALARLARDAHRARGGSVAESEDGRLAAQVGRLYELLSRDERELVRMRMARMPWATIAVRTKVNEALLRKRWSLLQERVRQAIGE